MKSLFYGNIQDWEIDRYKIALAEIQNIHISAEAAKRLKHIITICTMQESLPIDSEGVIDPVGTPGYIEPSYPYFGKPIKFTIKTEER